MYIGIILLSLIDDNYITHTYMRFLVRLCKLGTEYGGERGIAGVGSWLGLALYVIVVAIL